MKLFLHIGMQKAGSKAIQRFFVNNEAAFTERGIDSPLSLRDRVWSKSFFMSYDDVFDEALRRESEKSENIFLSYEEAYTINSDTIKRMASHSSDVKVLFLARNPVSWTNSFLNQIIKSHRGDCGLVLNFNVKSPVFQKKLRIDSQLEKWADIVGKDAISVREYVPGCDAVQEFADWIDLDDAFMQSAVFSQENPNMAADMASIRIMIEVKKIVGNNIDERVMAMKVAHKELKSRWIDTREKSASFLLSDLQISQIKDEYGENYNNALREFGGHEPTGWPQSGRAASLCCSGGCLSRGV